MSADERPVAHPVNYREKGKYAKPFGGSGFGVMFEDDGRTGYLYATTEKFDQVFDALHLYNKGDSSQPRKGDQIFIVWNSGLQKAGIFYHNQFQAVVDFRNRVSCCRTGFPEGLASAKQLGWSPSHKWDETMTKGLEP